MMLRFHCFVVYPYNEEAFTYNRVTTKKDRVHASTNSPLQVNQAAPDCTLIYQFSKHDWFMTEIMIHEFSRRRLCFHSCLFFVRWFLSKIFLKQKKRTFTNLDGRMVCGSGKNPWNVVRIQIRGEPRIHLFQLWEILRHFPCFPRINSLIFMKSGIFMLVWYLVRLDWVWGDCWVPLKFSGKCVKMSKNTISQSERKTLDLPQNVTGSFLAHVTYFPQVV